MPDPPDDSDGHWPLLAACSGGWASCVSVLLAAGARRDRTSAFGLTAQEAATAADQHEVRGKHVCTYAYMSMCMCIH